MLKYAIHHAKQLTFPVKYNNLAEMFIDVAKKHPKNGMTFIEISGEERFLSYAQLIENAKYYLGSLIKNGMMPGDIVILVVNQDLQQFYNVFWACILGGFIVVPVTQPSFEEGSTTLSKLQHIWDVLKKPVVIVEEKYLKHFQDLKNRPEFSSLHLVSVDQIKAYDSQGKIHIGKSTDIAILQCSSGSTSSPKAVQLTHGNILTNLCSMQHAFELNVDDRVFTWLPHTHDMGLFFQYLTPVITGCNLFIFSPMTFTRAPYLFLKKITEHRGSWFGSPNFGLDWMIKNISNDDVANLDLSSVRFILNGAEPISVDVMEEFSQKFVHCGLKVNALRAGYGMAEVTVCATVSKLSAPLKVDYVDRQKLMADRIAVPVNKGDGATFIHVGYPVDEISLRIVDEQDNVVLENNVGEIQIKGPSVTSGYFNCSNLTEQLYTGDWLHTGDLGYMNDGSLVIVGRIKDVLFVRGQNYFAHDLEEILFKKGIVRRGNVLILGNFNDKTQNEELLVFIKSKSKLDEFLNVRQLIIDALNSTLGLAVSHVIPVKTIPKTTSGKLQRYILQKNYVRGDYDALIKEINAKLVLNETPEATSKFSESLLEDKLRKIWSNLLNIPENKISIEDTFFSLGGNSLKAFQLLNEVSKSLNREIDPEILVVCKNIKQMMWYLQTNQESGKKIKSQLERKNEPGFSGPIAITGMAFRLPKAITQKQLWKNLSSKKHSVKKISEKRKNLASELEWQDWIGELDDIDYFDNNFFDISSEEAVFIDPQQRLVLETAYHALEDAGVIPELDTEQNIGVYSGVSMNTYYQLITKYLKIKGMDALHQHALIGNLCNVISSRVSSQFNFIGPSLVIDTACSSFLVALHHATMALREDKIKGAVVIGSNVLVTSEVHSLSRKAGILSAGKRAKVFDKNADGTVLGEGVVVFYLETLQNALQKNKQIYGLIKGSAINNDGGSFGIMAPSPIGQYQVLAKAYEDAKILPNDIDYVEMHGTGTTLGDFIEVNALSKLFSEHVKIDKKRIGIGSVKTNIGHLLPAAGGAGLAKILLCFKNRKWIPNGYLKKVNPLLKLEKSPFYVVNTVETWDIQPDKTRKAGLTSLGLGGTNAHVILEEWISEPKMYDAKALNLLTVSAKSPNALNELFKQLKNRLKNEIDIDIHNVCFTHNRYRKHYPYRAACVISEVGIEKNFYNKSITSNSNRIELVIHDLDTKDKPASQDKFDHWFAVLEKLQEFSKQPMNIIGVDSGESLADLLNGKKQYAESLDNYLNGTPKRKKNSIDNINRFKPDILIHLTHSKNLILSKNFSNSPKVIRRTPVTINPVDYNLYSLMAELYISGADFNWELIHPDGTGKIIHLSPYPFEANSFWINQ